MTDTFKRKVIPRRPLNFPGSRRIAKNLRKGTTSYARAQDEQIASLRFLNERVI